MVFVDDWLQFAVDLELRCLRATGAADVGAPGGQLLAALGNREGLIVGHVIHRMAGSDMRQDCNTASVVSSANKMGILLMAKSLSSGWGSCLRPPRPRWRY